MNIDLVNRLVKENPESLIELEETHLREQMNIIIRHAEDKNAYIFFIGGPSTSGKTTYAKLLAKQINGLSISLDDFYVDRDKTPLGEDGKPDYECIGAIDLDRFNRTLNDLLAGESVSLPTFDFISGKHTDGDPVQLNNRKIIIEGLHALNPQVWYPFKDVSMKVFVHAKTEMLGHQVRGSQQRLMRRLVRDSLTRGRTYEATLEAAASVRAGESIWIYPFKQCADMCVNTFTLYETNLLAAVLKDCGIKWVERYLDKFEPLDLKYIPKNALCREFMGGLEIN